MSGSKRQRNALQALTANGLHTGSVVYLDRNLKWSTAYANALITTNAELIERMQTVGARDEAANLVVDAYFIDVDPETVLPVHYRERFRVNGPSYNPEYLPMQKVGKRAAQKSLESNYVSV